MLGSIYLSVEATLTGIPFCRFRRDRIQIQCRFFYYTIIYFFYHLYIDAVKTFPLKDFLKKTNPNIKVYYKIYDNVKICIHQGTMT